MRRRDELIGEIEKAEALLSHLEGEQEQARARVAALREELAFRGGLSPGFVSTCRPLRRSRCPGAPRRKSGCFGSSSAVVQMSSRLGS